MLFEVLFDGKVRASTSYLECIPTKNTLLDMEHAGYIFRLDRKRYKARDIVKKLMADYRCST